MEQNYIIFADMAADMPADFALGEDIHFVPMHYTLGQEDKTCKEPESDELRRCFYQRQRNGDATYTTQIPPQIYMDLFRPLLQAGKSILYLSLSSGISGTYNSACIAAAELWEEGYPGTVLCVDTLSASAGIGILAEAAAENRRQGMSLRENARWLEDNRQRVCHWFMVDDLLYLKRGGRVSAATALVGTALNIKPLLKIESDGTLKNFSKSRGAKAAMNQLVSLYASTREATPNERVYIIHADNNEGADYLEEAIQKCNPGCRVARVFLNPIIGAHTGPGLCAIVHFGKQDSRETE